MAVIPRSSRTTLSSGRVTGSGVSIPNSISDTGQGLEAAGLGDVGRGITQTAMIMKEIKDRKDSAIDSSQTSKDKKAAELAQISLKTRAAEIPLNKRDDFYKENYPEIHNPDNFATPEGAAASKAESDFRRDKFLANSSLEIAQIAVMDAVQVTEEDVWGNPSIENQAIYKKSLLIQGMSEERADDLVAKAVAVGNDLLNKKAVDTQLQLAAESEFSAQAVIERMELLLESRATGEKDTSALSNTDARDIIGTAEAELTQQKNKRESEETETTNQAKNEALSESYEGELTVAELDRRFKAGMLGDDNASRTSYKSLRKSLEQIVPEESDLLVRDEMSTAITRFKAGQISKRDVNMVFLDSLASLDKEDRKKFQNDISTTSTTLIQTGVSNMKAGGNELISPRFRTPDGGIIADIDPTGKKDKEQLAKEKKLFNLEIRLKNLYNDAIDEWIESKAGEDITNRDMRIKENDLKIDFRKIKNQELDKMEADIIEIEQPAPVPSMTEQSRSLRQLKTDQLKARREELRKQLK